MLNKYDQLMANLKLNFSYYNPAVQYFSQTIEYTILKDLNESQIITGNQFESLCIYGQSLIIQLFKKHNLKQ